MFGIASPPLLDNLDKAQGDALLNCRDDGVALHPIPDEVRVSDDQLAVVLAAMVSQFDLEPRKQPMTGYRQGTERCRSQHLNRARRELPGNPVLASAHASHARAPAALGLGHRHHAQGIHSR